MINLAVARRTIHYREQSALAERIGDLASIQAAFLARTAFMVSNDL